MRWLVAAPGPGFSVADVYEGWVEALRNAGEKVITHPLDAILSFYDAVLLPHRPGVAKKALTAEQATELAADRLAGALYKVRPDVLVVVSGFFADPVLLDLARRDGVKVVTLHTEEPYEHERELALAKHADIAIVNDPVNLDEFRSVTRAEYFGHAYRPGIHHPGPADPALACDFGFAGTAYPSRVQFLEAMDLEGVDTILAGNWERLPTESPLWRYVATPSACLDNSLTADLYRSAKVGINLYRREGQQLDGWAAGPREIEAAACGHFILRDPRGEGDELFPWLPTFSSPAEASALLREWIPRDDERAALASKAREAIADRTFDAHAARLLRLLERK